MVKNSIGNEILLNIMYTGTYLDDNIGHEIINLFKDDKGRHYIYVLPYGSMGREHNNRIRTILLVRRCSTKLFEILAKAEDLEQIVQIRTTCKNKDEIERVRKEQLNYIRENNITYGGVLLNNILKDWGFITFAAKKVTKVAKALYITTDETLNSENCKFG